jgi:hypothetical protein
MDSVRTALAGRDSQRLQAAADALADALFYWEDI